MKLPKVLLDNGDFRLVAVGRTTAGQAIHTNHLVVDTGVPESDSVRVEVRPEVRRTDSLGEVSWVACSVEQAVHENLLSQLRFALEEKTQPAPKMSKVLKPEADPK
jgi:hypothetical protein